MMLTFRCLTDADVAQVADFAIEGMRPHLYPMRLSRAKVLAMIDHFRITPTDFHLVAFKGEKLVGIIAALVVEHPWCEKCSAHVVACRAMCGCGLRLLRALRDWFMGDMRVRHVSFALEFDADDRMRMLLHHLGFKQQQTVLNYYKGSA